MNVNLSPRNPRNLYFLNSKDLKKLILNEKLDNVETLMLYFNDNTQKSEIFIYYQLILLLFIVLGIVIHYKLL